MAKPVMSKKKAHVLSVVLFLIGLGILTYVKIWWPPIMLVIGLPMALRQYLVGRIYDMVITLIVFLGVYITVQFQIKWDLLLPILFTVGGIYIFFREFFEPKVSTEPEKEEDLNKEIEEKQHKED